MSFHTILQYDSWSRGYDKEFLDNYKYLAPRETFNAVAARTDISAPALRILDVGCGTGLLSAEFRRANKHAYIAGIDFSSGMLERFAAKNIADRLERGDITQTLPFESESFDLAVSTGVFELISRPASTIAEMSRILKPGGILAVTSPHNWWDRPNTWEKFKPSLTALANWIDRGKSHRAAYMEAAMRRSDIAPIERVQFAGYRKHGSKAPYQLYIGQKLDNS